MARDEDRVERSLCRWCLAAIAAAVLCFAAATVWATLNQDEGWYLYAARQVLQGRLPHRDFFFTQGLGFPVFYALFAWFWSPMGVLGGRLLTALISLTAIFVSAETVARSCRKLADAWCARLLLWSFLGLNLWYVSFTTIPKTYALCALWLALGFRALATIRDARGVLPPWAAASGFCLTMAAGARLSMGVALPVAGLWLLVKRDWIGRRVWIWFALGGAAGLFLAAGVDFLLWPEAFKEMLAFHAARESVGWLGIPGSLARLFRHNPLLTACLLLLGYLRATGKPALKAPGARSGFVGLWLACAAALGAVHLAVPVPYDDYQAPTVFLLAMAGASAFCALPFESLRLALVRGIALAALCVTVAGSPVLEQWVCQGKDRLWVRWRAEPELFALRRAAAVVREALDRHGCPNVLLTQDAYLAVEADAALPEGYEMGPFMPPQEGIPAGVAVAAWSGYAFAMDFPSLSRRPEPARNVALRRWRDAFPETLAVLPGFGQGATELTIAFRPEAAAGRAAFHSCPQCAPTRKDEP